MPLTYTIAGTLDLPALQASNPQRYPFLLQSVMQGSPRARFDILFAFPQQYIKLQIADPDPIDFLHELDRHWASSRIPDTSNTGLPFRGGWFLYLGYELAAQIEPRLTLPVATDGLPTACAVRIPAAVIVDHLTQQSHCLAEAGLPDALESLRGDCLALSPAAPTDDQAALDAHIHETDDTTFLRGVERIRHYIIDGDVFQVNLSRGWEIRQQTPASALEIYRRLCHANPAPYAGLVLLDDAAIISSSPELLVKVENGRVETRPIAGTRPRNAIDSIDHALREELLAHPKERAEHIMLIDLERNDLGRVCIPGTVQVEELMALESYAHVHHIVSQVTGELRPGITPAQLIRAVFPGGTITGCPKVRCMEIIAELEGEGRGAYTGSMGYLNHNGDMALNILIRTLVQTNDRIRLRAGAGIVADSVAARELEETRAKAKGLLQALTSPAGSSSPAASHANLQHHDY